MKALSIKQPWAWLVAVGYKDIENRSWATSYRGRFQIHAGQRWDIRPDEREWFEQYLESRLTPEQMARYHEAVPTMAVGSLIGESCLYDCVERGDWTANGSKWFDGPYGFACRDSQLWQQPVPDRGPLGVFDVGLPVARQ